MNQTIGEEIAIIAAQAPLPQPRAGITYAPAPNGPDDAAILRASLADFAIPAAAANTGALDKPIAVMRFVDVNALEMRQEQMSMRRLAISVTTTGAEQKHLLPLLKLATFGDQRTDKGSLRHNGNVLAITGIEGDYDGEAIGVDQAIALLRAAGIACLLYTSPSHTEDAPRWRVVCPLSQELAPEERAGLVARLNGTLQGSLSNESFTLSQSYYFGSVKGNPSHRAELVDGDCIDLRPDLDAGAIGKATKTYAAGRPASYGADTPVSDKRLNGYISSVLDGFSKRLVEGRKHSMLLSAAIALGGVAAQAGMSNAQGIQRLMDCLPDTVRDWRAAQRTAEWGLDRGRERPITLEDREPPAGNNGHTSPPAPDDDPGYQASLEADAQRHGTRRQSAAAPEPEPQPAPNDGDETTEEPGESQRGAQRGRGASNRWQRLLQTTRSGPRGNLFNACIALTHADEWRGRLALNEFADAITLQASPPWEPAGEAFTPRAMTDADFIAVAVWLQSRGIQASSKIAAEAAIAVAMKNRINPVLAYLHGLTWDGTKRINTWLCDHLGAEDTPYTQAVCAKSLISAVVRAEEPGAKVDTVPILESRQGLGKSTALRILFGPAWFTDTMPDLHDKDAMVQLQGIWGVEFPDLAKLGKADANTVKGFLAKRVDRFRRPYGRICEDISRRCVFWVTVNPRGVGYLRDETGARRFWPIACAVGWVPSRKVDFNALAQVRDQLWAEAVTRWREGEAHWFKEEGLVAAQEQAAEARYEADAWTDMILDFVAGKPDVSAAEILQRCLHKDPGTWQRADEMRVGAVMTTARWVRRKKRDENGKPKWRYINPDISSQDDTGT